MDYSAMEQYWIWLSSVPGMSARAFYRLISIFEDPRTVWDEALGPAPADIHKNVWSAVQAARDERHFIDLFRKLDKSGCRAYLMTEDAYPQRLSSIEFPPPVLYVRGEADLSPDKVFAIVGTRHPTTDGRRAAREYARTLSENGVTVVSGLAYGVDAEAHTGALEGGSPTIAVLGSPIDSIQPKSNEPLAEEILEKGGAIISEYPPDLPYHKNSFPLRNRIISGLTDGTLMVEGTEKSGGLITVNFAMEQHREVFAVPGSVYNPQAAGPNRLLYDGAQMALSPWDILESLRWASRPGAKKPAPAQKIELTPTEEAILSAIRQESRSFDEIARETGITAGNLASLLSFLELRGLLEKQPGGLYRTYIG